MRPLKSSMLTGKPPGERERSKPVPRLAHKKSKTGCQRCRARRVKCDETHPVCRNCERHSVPCVYDHDVPSALDAPTSEHSTPPSAFASSSQTPTPLSPPPLNQPLESRETRLLELRLIHQFTKQTSADMVVTHPTPASDIWSTAVPRLAFNHDSVLYALYALTALHIAKADPIWPYEEAMSIHRRYLDLALPAHSADVANLSAENADAACLSSTLLRITAFAYLSERPHEIIYTPPIQWLQMTSAAVRVFHATWEWIQGDAAPLARQLINRRPLLSPFNPVLFQDSNRLGFEHLVMHTDPLELWDNEIDHAYKVAVSYLGSVLIAIASGEETGSDLCRRIIGFPMLVHPRFVSLVEEEQPRALVILAHYFALVARLRGLWWMGDSGRREVLGIQTVVPGEWQDAMTWPLESIQDETNVMFVPEQIGLGG